MSNKGPNRKKGEEIPPLRGFSYITFSTNDIFLHKEGKYERKKSAVAMSKKLKTCSFLIKKLSKFNIIAHLVKYI